MTRWLRLLGLWGVLACGTPVAAATYFVSPDGDDARDGRSPAAAWRSVERVHRGPLGPGDVVAFARGGVWHTPLAPTASGTHEAPLVLTAYGDGPPPRFDGSDAVALDGAQSVRGEAFALLLNGAFLRTPQDWRIEGGAIRLTAAPPAGAELRAVRREDMIHLQGVEHVVVRGLWADATARLHGGYGFRVERCREVTLEDCVATRAGKHHFGIINSTGVLVRRCRASLVMPDQGVGGASTFVSYSDSSRQGDTSRYEDCVVEQYRDATDKGQYPAFVTHGEGVGEVSITRLTSRGAGFSLNNRESGAKLSVIDSYVEEGSVGLFGKGCVLENLTLRRGVLTLDGEANVVRRSAILDANPGFLGYQSAVVNTGRQNLLEECLVRLDPGSKPFNACLALVAPTSALEWRNCRFETPGCAVRTWFADVTAAGCRAAGNTYPPGATFQLKGVEQPLDLAAWRQFGLDAE